MLNLTTKYSIGSLLQVNYDISSYIFIDPNEKTGNYCLINKGSILFLLGIEPSYKTAGGFCKYYDIIFLYNGKKQIIFGLHNETFEEIFVEVK